VVRRRGEKEKRRRGRLGEMMIRNISSWGMARNRFLEL
jgi:hypothetical protein